MHTCAAWHSMVKLAAVDCADIKNQPVCREHRISIYPTLTVSLLFCELFDYKAVGDITLT